MRRVLQVLLLASACTTCGPRAARAEGEPAPSTPGFAGKPVEWWIEELADERTREVAQEALLAIGAPATPALVRALANERVSVRRGAALALGRLPWPGDAALPTLIGALSDAWPEVRQPVLRTLSNVPSGLGRSVTPRVVPLLRDPDLPTRREAARFVARYPLDDLATIERLTEALRDADPEVRESAAGALSGLGPKAGPAVDALLVLARDPKISVRQTVFVALARCGSTRPEVLGVFLDAAKDPNVNVRSSALEGLRVFAATSDEALRALGAALDSDDRSERRAVLHEIGRLGPRGASLLPKLLALLCDASPDIAYAALDAICGLGEAAAPALRLLVRAAAAGVGAAGRVLHQLAATHVTELLDAIEGDPSRRDVVLEALAGARTEALSKTGPQVVEALAPMLVDPHVTRPARAAAVHLLRRTAHACPPCREAAGRAAIAFLEAAAPSPEDFLGEAWLLIGGARGDRSVGFARMQTPEDLRWTVGVLDAVTGRPTIPVDRRLEALRLLGVLAVDARGDAWKVLEARASDAEPAVAAAAKAALEQPRKERRR